ncbi:MAG: NUDIX hydrolase N-terminal domain-containing protein [Caldilineaceae bacterium]|nr:NUDIX hydrolase N-terminal domain-containing protein [Caldilineaceae bacterium]
MEIPSDPLVKSVTTLLEERIPMTPAQQLALWADQLRAMAGQGLYYAQDVYNQERYHKIQSIALELMALATGDTLAQFAPLRDTLLVHPTPFAVGDAAIIDEAGRILLIQRADNQLWAMPGGALDVGETAAAGVVREALEESGVHCEVTGVVGIFDSRLWGAQTRHHLYQLTFLCRPLALPPVAVPSHAHEVLGHQWFAEADLPPDLDPNHIGRIPIAFQVWRGDRPPHFDL